MCDRRKGKEIMDWGQAIFVVSANLATVITLFLWSRHESTEDRKVQADDRRDILNLIRAIEQEMKDFHGRLCAIEERGKK